MASEKRTVLLGTWVSPFSLRCRIALAEKGIEYEYIEENLSDKSPLLLKTNPVHKKVPVLIHGDNSVCESLVIMQYIDEAWDGGVQILPEDPYARAQARFWADFFDNKVFQSARNLWTLQGDKREEAKKEFIGNMKLLEAEIDNKKFFGGDAFGFVDIVCVSFTSFFYSFEKAYNIDMEKEVPKLDAWRKRCLQRESVAKTLPDPQKVYEFLKARFGLP